jgi:hypothetical protein
MSDLLIEWMSYRRYGRKDDLPQELLAGEPPARTLADLATLAHTDVAADGTWRIAPPVLAAGEDQNGIRAVLCGARTPKLLERVRTSCRSAGADLAETAQEGRPSVFTVSAADGAQLTSIAAMAGIECQRDAAFTLLACLPAIPEWPRTPCPMVVGRVASVTRFSRSQRFWVPASLEQATQASRGFFRIRRDWDWVNLLKEGPDRQAQIDIYAGRLAAAQGAKAARWDPLSGSLHFPVALSPPTLIARGLALCTGRLPHRDRANRTLAFQEVPLRTARLAIALTGLRLV